MVSMAVYTSNEQPSAAPVPRMRKREEIRSTKQHTHRPRTTSKHFHNRRRRACKIHQSSSNNIAQTPNTNQSTKKTKSDMGGSSPTTSSNIKKTRSMQTSPPTQTTASATAPVTIPTTSSPTSSPCSSSQITPNTLQTRTTSSADSGAYGNNAYGNKGLPPGAQANTDTLKSSTPAPASSSTTPTKAPASTNTQSSGGWIQVANFSSGGSTGPQSHGLTFLANKGGGLSGINSGVYGQSLAYVTPDGSSPAKSAEVWSGSLDSEVGITVMTDKPCGAPDINGNCGYYLDGTVAYQGFSGVQRAVFFKFTMPHTSAASGGYYWDLPAIWSLNALISNTGQFSGNNCWQSGCGEFDILEVVKDSMIPDPDRVKGQVCLHTNYQNGGMGDYLPRPVDTFMTLAVLYSGSSIKIQIVPDFDFGYYSGGAAVQEMLAKTSSPDYPIASVSSNVKT